MIRGGTIYNRRNVVIFKLVIMEFIGLIVLSSVTVAIVQSLRVSALQNDVEQLTQQVILYKQGAGDAQDKSPTGSSSNSSSDIKNIGESSDPGDSTDAVHYTKPYQKLYPDMRVDNQVEAKLPEKNTVYLTFDDGPSENTVKVLDTLKLYGIRATFFVIGREDDESLALYKRIVDEGHTLAIHSYTHNYEQIYESVDAYLADFNRLYELLYKTTGQYPTMFRFPGGSNNVYAERSGITGELIAEMTRRGFVYYDWNVSSQDASNPPPSISSITNNATKYSRKSTVSQVLFHDSKPKVNTAAALPNIIEYYAAEGFVFDRLTPEVTPVQFKSLSDYSEYAEDDHSDQ